MSTCRPPWCAFHGPAQPRNRNPALARQRASLEASAREVGALAAIRAVPSERGVEVWIADRVTGKTVLREMEDDGGTPDRDAALALRVVELLRASLLEAALPTPPPGEVPATPEIREKMRVPAPAAPAEGPASALRLSLAPGVLLSPGGLGATASVGLGLAWMPREHVGVVGLVAIPILGARIERPEGSADLAVLLAGGGVRFAVSTRASRWTSSVDLGASAVWLRSTGVAGAGYLGRASSAVTASPFVRLGLADAVTPMFRVRADVLTGMIAHGVSIRFAQREAATWGKPFVLSSAGVDFGWR
ncbi:hypothetical protein [Sorangium cellulosum]|uniref:hypothetical protein n=1 Tax=Sorangium cellulosum TaxID=56 RepID=UPI00101325B1|nr:hypothetical protein [Sorangium cellulosum]